MSCKPKRVVFLSDSLKLIGNLYLPKGKGKLPGVLFLHGSRGPKDTFLPWQEKLCEEGFSSLAYDTRGVGESGGEFKNASINNRFLDAKHAYEFFISTAKVDPEKVVVVAESMGGHVAAKMTTEFPEIQSLILLGAAAYHPDAEDKMLDESFTAIIRRPESWKESPVFGWLKDFGGSLLVIYGEHDQVVPDGVKQLYKETLKQSDHFIIMDGAEHELVDNPRTLPIVIRETLDFLQ